MKQHSVLQAVETRLRAGQRFDVATTARGELIVGRRDTTMRVVVRLQQGGDAVALVMHAPICHEHVVHARVALEAAARMGAGAIALLEDAYVVRYSIPEQAVAGAPLEQIVTYVADLAAELAMAFAARELGMDSDTFAYAM